MPAGTETLAAELQNLAAAVGRGALPLQNFVALAVQAYCLAADAPQVLFIMHGLGSFGVIPDVHNSNTDQCTGFLCSCSTSLLQGPRFRAQSLQLNEKGCDPEKPVHSNFMYWN